MAPRSALYLLVILAPVLRCDAEYCPGNKIVPAVRWKATGTVEIAIGAALQASVVKEIDGRNATGGHFTLPANPGLLETMSVFQVTKSSLRSSSIYASKPTMRLTAGRTYELSYFYNLQASNVMVTEWSTYANRTANNAGPLYTNVVPGSFSRCSSFGLPCPMIVTSELQLSRSTFTSPDGNEVAASFSIFLDTGDNPPGSITEVAMAGGCVQELGTQSY